MVVNGKTDWLLELKAMWTEAFGDEEEAVELFYHCFFTEERTWCYVEKGEPVSVIYGIPALLWSEHAGEKHKIMYLYAGTTRQDARGKGFYGKMMRRAGRYEDDKGTAVLMPLRSLIPFYKKLGFTLVADEKDYFMSRESIGQKPSAPMRVLQDTITGSRYKQIRDERLGKPGFLEWDEKFLSFAIHSLLKEGGIAAEILLKGQSHVILAKSQDGYLKILETTLSREQLIRHGSILLGQEHYKGICVKGGVLMSAGGDWPFQPYFRIGLDE